MPYKLIALRFEDMLPEDAPDETIIFVRKLDRLRNGNYERLALLAIIYERYVGEDVTLSNREEVNEITKQLVNTLLDGATKFGDTKAEAKKKEEREREKSHTELRHAIHQVKERNAKTQERFRKAVEKVSQTFTRVSAVVEWYMRSARNDFAEQVKEQAFARLETTAEKKDVLLIAFVRGRMELQTFVSAYFGEEWQSAERFVDDYNKFFTTYDFRRDGVGCLVPVHKC